MPNWTYTSISAVGKKKDLEKFIDYLYNIEDDNDKRYFYRTFPQGLCRLEEKESLEDLDCNELYSYYTTVECAWSAEGCLLMKGFYRSESVEKDCVDLQEVTSELNLAVEVYSEECGVGFQEHIVCVFGKELLNEEVEYSEEYDEETGETNYIGGFVWEENDLTVFFNKDGGPKNEIEDLIYNIESIKVGD